MKIVFRCDASFDIGLGHLVRSLALIEELVSHNHIILATIEDGAKPYISKRVNKFDTFFKEKNEEEEEFLRRIKVVLKPNVIVIDKKYPYSSEFLNQLKGENIKIIMIDNICEGLCASDEIIFPTAHLDKTLLEKYLSQEKIDSVKTGFEYIILRKEVLILKDKTQPGLHTSSKVVVTTGGTDPEGVLLKLIPWIKDMALDARILLLLGQSFRFRNELKHLVTNLPNNIHLMSYSLKEVIKGDIVICTFGVSVYEMIYLGIPTICISHNIENADGARMLKKRYGVIEDLGYVEDISVQSLHSAVIKLLSDRILCRNIFEKSRNLIDGRGIKRISQIITRARLYV